MRSSLVTVPMLLLAASTAAAQGRCAHRTYDGDEMVFATDYQLDAAGRVIVEEFTNDRAAFSTTSQFAYGADGQLSRVLVEVTEGPTGAGAQPPIRYSYTTSGTQLIERQVTDVSGSERVARWTFDPQGLPAEIEIRATTELPRGSRTRCAFDLLGRPIYRAEGPLEDSTYETRWIWDDGRLTRVVHTTPDGDRNLQVVRSGRTVQLRSTDGVDEQWIGECEQLMFSTCSPALAPRPPSGERRLIPPRVAVRPARVPPSRRNRFAPLPVDRALDLPMLAAQYVGREVFTSVTFGENDPGYPIPVVCAGPSFEECETTVHYSEIDHRVLYVVSTDRGLVGGEALRVGARYAEVAGELRNCLIDRGLELAIYCEVDGHPGVTAWFDGLDGDPAHNDEGPPTAAMTRVARLIRLEWRAPNR